MNLNINLKPKKSFIKKLIILILFTVFCFFIKENVFALSVPDYLENFSDYTVICEDSYNYNYSVCLNSSNHSFKAFIEYYIMLTHKFSLISDNGTSSGGNFKLYFFPLTPYFKEVKVSNYSVYNIYDTSSKKDFLTYISITCYPDSKKCFNPQYEKSRWNFVPPDDANFLNNYFYSSLFNNIIHSNFDLLDTDNNIIFNTTSSGTVDWTNSTDIDDPDTRNFFEKLFDSILDIFYTLGNLANNLINGISDLLISLFVPGDELEGFFNDEYEFILKKLGFLSYPIEVIIDFSNRFYSLEDSNSAIFKIPKLEFMGNTLYEGTSFDLMFLINSNDNFKNIYSIYKIAVSGFIVLWLVQLAIKKEEEMFGGGFN